MKNTKPDRGRRIVVALLVAAGVYGLRLEAATQTNELAPGTFTDFRSDVKEYRELFKLIRSTLDHNAVSFQGKTGTIYGFAAGAAYPQIWLRDAYTIIPASRLFYEAPYLQSWLEEHLAFQRDDGSLEDWIDSRGKRDKNTTETDQETSAVRAAARIARISGTAWLRKMIDGESIIGRLERALGSVLRSRFDKGHGLVTGAHTADWGDVDMGREDQRAISIDQRTHWTCDIYDQSEFHGAALDLAWMLTSDGQTEKARFWSGQAALIRKNADRWLWQEERGFYRVHIHLDALRHDFDEDAMFAMGGNTEAILSGLASEDKCRRIIETALTRQKEFSMSTISGTLLPPYPKGFFKHPMLDQPYEYQNGGQWDWFGGRLIHAMFEHGFSREARRKLSEIAGKAIANRGLFEWDSPAGIGQGSPFYSGSAGSLAEALFEGYFGFKIAKDEWSLEPKLAEDNAAVHVYYPAAGIFAAYDYRWDGKNTAVAFRYNGNLPNPGKVKIFVPWLHENGGPIEKLKNVDVRRDGRKIAFLPAVLNGDAFVVVETDFKNHILEIRQNR